MNFTDKYQPKTEKQIIGKSQQQTAANLEKVAVGINIKPILLVGESGTGKTTLAYMFANMLERENQVEILHVNCADDTGVNRARELGSAFQVGSLFGGYKVYFLDEVHKLTKPAQEALLLPLEEGLNPNTVIIAATTEEANLIKTFRSRFSRYYLQNPTVIELNKLCHWISKAEGFELALELRDEIVVKSEGNVRDLVTFLEQIANGTYTSSIVIAEYEQSVIGMLRLNDVTGLLTKVEDYNSTLIGVCNYAIKVLQSGPDAFAYKILRVFGRGLNDKLPQNVAWAKLVVEYVDNN